MHDGRLSVAVVGTGHWGPNLIRNFFEDPRVWLAYVFDADVDRARQVIARYPYVPLAKDVQEVLNDREVDAVVLCTPSATHHSLAKQALAAGKHVFVEKPMALTSAHCDELIRLAKTQGRKLMVGHVFLYNPAVQYVRDLIAKGDLGELVYLHAKRLNLGPIRKDVNALWDLAPHDIAICNYWLGAKPVEAHAMGIPHIHPPLEDVVFGYLTYPGKVGLSLHVSWMDPRKIRQIVAVGTKKMVMFDDLDPVGAVQIYDKTIRKGGNPDAITDTISAFKAVIQEGDLLIPRIPAGEPLRNECRAFVEHLLDDKPILSDGHDGLDTVMALEALSRSLAANGRPEKVG